MDRDELLELIRLLVRQSEPAQPVAGIETPSASAVNEGGSSTAGVTIRESRGTADVSELIGQLERAERSSQSSSASLRAATEAFVAATSKRESTADSGGGISGVISKTALTGPGIGPLLKWAFGGSSEDKPVEPLVRFQAPSSIREEVGYDSYSREFVPIGYSQSGLPRATAGAAQITVNVQTMDSRSFLDNSGEIARAVREAMLNSHELNDVITEL